MAAGWANASVLMKFFFIACHVSLLIFVLGYSTPYWISASGQIPVTLYDTDGGVTGVKLDHLGLWQACGDLPNDQSCITILIDKTPAWYGATRAFETMALIGAILLSLAMLLWMFVQYFKEWNRAPFVMMITTFVTAGLMLIGVIIWGAEVKYYLHWSFAFACMSTIIYSVVGILMLCNMLLR